MEASSQLHFTADLPKIDHFFLIDLRMCTASKYHTDTSVIVMLLVSFEHLYYVLLLEQDCCYCCHLLDGKVANKIQECFRSREYYQAYGITRKLMKGVKLVRNVSYFYDSPQKSGKNCHHAVRPGEKAPLGERLDKS
jgi:hypothetical protein